MKNNGRPKGINLLTVAVGTGILAIGILVFMQMQARFSQSSARIEQGLRGEEALTLIATEIQNLPLGQIEKICQDNAAFTSAPTAKCVTGTSLTAGNTLPYKAGDPVLNVRIAYDRQPNQEGPMCVEISKCSWLGAQHMLEATFTGYWKDPNPDRSLVSKTVTIRRVRW